MRPFRCPSCSRELVEISLEVAGETVVMRSCSSCDIRTWHTAEGPVALDGVLEGISAATRRR